MGIWDRENFHHHPLVSWLVTWAIVIGLFLLIDWIW